MARYTVELRTIMQDSNTQPLLNKALSTYPMYQPKSNNEEVLAVIPTREKLNEKILNHFKYREIGFETIGRFLDELEITMNEIMPFYNQMFKTVEIMALIEDPFGNVDVTEKFTQTRTGTATTAGTDKNVSSSGDSSQSTTTGENYGKVLESETPQGNIAKTANEIDDVTHADKATWSKNDDKTTVTVSNNGSSNSTNESESESETNETLEHTFTKTGNQGVNTYAHDMVEFRTSIIDVVTQILDDIRLKNLFLQVF